MLHPGRICLGVGSGEAMNEVPSGFDWPDTKVRLARTTESIQIIKKLWNEGKKEKMDLLILKVNIFQLEMLYVYYGFYIIYSPSYIRRMYYSFKFSRSLR